MARRSNEATANRPDVYTRGTARIVTELKRGVRPWLRPSNAGNSTAGITRPLRHNGQPYSGINVVLLWSEAVVRGHTSPIGMTFRQALELGGHVRKGETGAMVVYANRITRAATTDAGEEVECEIPFLKAYIGFNIAQIDGLPAKFGTIPQPVLDPVRRIGHAEAFVAATHATVRHGGNQDFYAMLSDHVQMPPFGTFRDPETYYATLMHELTQWARHPSRLDRDFGRQRWGDEGHAREELVAELGAAFLCADLGLALEPRPDHASSVASWPSRRAPARRCHQGLRATRG